jgi:hypothetical protein
MAGRAMNRHFYSVLLASALLVGPAQALILAISPVVDQPAREEPAEGKTMPRVRSAPTAEPGGRELPANPLWAIPLKQLSNTRERPIFSPSRRPPTPAVAGPPPPTAAVRVPAKSAGPQSPELALIGTVIGEKESIAVFVDETTKNAVRLRTGDAHKGWTLRSVQGREATLEKDRESVLLSLPQPGAEQTASIPSAVGNRPSNRRR